MQNPPAAADIFRVELCSRCRRGRNLHFETEPEGSHLYPRRHPDPRLGIVLVPAGFYLFLPGVLAQPIAADTGWSLGRVAGGLSVGLLADGLVAPRVGRTIDAKGGPAAFVASSVLPAAGFVGLALAHSPPVYLTA